MTRRVVHRVEDGADRQQIEATTYQMRNMYQQLGDGFFTALDVMNYIQHHYAAVRLCRAGDRVLDICCGRGLMLPLLRYHAQPALYVGVDIEPKNVVFAHAKRVTDGKPVRADYYPFPVTFVEANVASMAAPLRAAGYRAFDLLIYMASIEHMHPDAGLASLHDARAVAAPGARLLLTGPNTPEHQNGYDTRYRAHVYEWKRSELRAGLERNGWRIEQEWGLMMGKRDLKAAAQTRGLAPFVAMLERVIPNEWLLPVLASLFPKEASEIAMLAVAT